LNRVFNNGPTFSGSLIQSLLLKITYRTIPTNVYKGYQQGYPGRSEDFQETCYSQLLMLRNRVPASQSGWSSLLMTRIIVFPVW